MENDLPRYVDFILALFFIFGPLILAPFYLKKEADKRQRYDILFLLYIVICVGIQGFFYGLWQVFHPHRVAEFVHWPYSPFMLELGMANISFGILGILSPWREREWRVTTAVGYGLFLSLTAMLHLVRLAHFGSTPGDAGGFLLSDIFISLILFYLVIKTKKQTSEIQSQVED